MKNRSVYLIFILICTNAFANIADPRIKIIPYKKNDIIPVTGMHFVSTQIILGSDEHIVDIQGGDADAWTVNVDKTFSNIFNIKPTISGSHSNLTVITTDALSERRHYYFELNSVEYTTDASGKTYAIIFDYPEKQKERPNQSIPHPAESITHHTHYRYHGDRNVMPYRVFDDGQFTYFEFKPHQPIPAIFAVLNAWGEEGVVNFRRENNRIIVLQIAPQFTLRLGRQTASIFNDSSERTS